MKIGNKKIEGTKFEFKLLKQDKSNLVEFTKALSSIVYYMVKYDSLVMIKEGAIENRLAKYALIASLQEMYDDSYIRTLTTGPTVAGRLSTFALSRLNIWKGGYTGSQGFWIDGWNQDHSSVKFWKDSNTYSIYMFDDADRFASKVARLFGVRYANGDPMSGLHTLIAGY